MTSQKQTSLFTEEQLTFLPEDSHVNRIHSPEKEKGIKILATSGRKCLEQYERFSRHSSWQKTFSALLIGTTAWYSSKSKLIWKMKATRYKRIYFQLVVSKRRTKEAGLGLLPTPTSTFNDVVDMEKLDVRRAKCLLSKKNWNGFGLSLNEMVRKGLLPTPTARDYPSGFNQQNEAFQQRQQHSRGVNLHEHIQRQIGVNFQLNPHYLIEMMGFPKGWTELPFLNGESKV